MYPVQYHRDIRGLIQQRLKVLDRLLLRQIQPKLLLDLLMHVAVLDVRYVRVNHQSDKVEYQVRAFAKDAEGGEAKVLEPGVMGGLRAAHSVDHFFTHFDGRREGFRVSTENVAKVNYGEIPAKSMDEWGDSREGKVSHHGRNVLRKRNVNG